MPALIILPANRPESTYYDEVIADSPIHYWRLGETAGASNALSEVSGVNMNNANVVFGVTGLLVGDSNTAASFNGSSAWLNGAGTERSGGDFTCEAWIKTTPSASGSRVIWAEFNTYSENRGFVLYHNGQYLEIQASDGAALKTYRGTGVVNTGSIFHVVGLVRSTAVEFYINGVLDPLTLNPGSVGNHAPTTSNNQIGAIANSAPPGAFFDGVIDEVALYNTALSPARILAHYNEGS